MVTYVSYVFDALRQPNAQTPFPKSVYITCLSRVKLVSIRINSIERPTAPTQSAPYCHLQPAHTAPSPSVTKLRVRGNEGSSRSLLKCSRSRFAGNAGSGAHKFWLLRRIPCSLCTRARARERASERERERESQLVRVRACVRTQRLTDVLCAQAFLQVFL